MVFNTIYKLLEGIVLPIGVVYGIARGLPYMARALGRRFSR